MKSLNWYKMLLKETFLDNILIKLYKFSIENSIVKSNSVSNRVCLSVPKNNTCKDAFNIKKELQSFKNEFFKSEMICHAIESL